MTAGAAGAAAPAFQIGTEAARPDAESAGQPLTLVGAARDSVRVAPEGAVDRESTRMDGTALTLADRAAFLDFVKVNRHCPLFREQIAGAGGVREAWSILDAGGVLVFGGGAHGATHVALDGAEE